MTAVIVSAAFARRTRGSRSCWPRIGWATIRNSASSSSRAFDLDRVGLTQPGYVQAPSGAVYALIFIGRSGEAFPSGLEIHAVVPALEPFDETVVDRDLWSILRWMIEGIGGEWTTRCNGCDRAPVPHSGQHGRRPLALLASTHVVRGSIHERSITGQPGTPGRHRRHHRQLSAGERARPGCRGRHQGLPGARQHRSGDQGDGADRRRPQLHRGRRHPRLRHQPSAPAARRARLRHARRQREAGDRRDPRLCTRRRAGDRDGLPLSHRTCRARRSGCRKC